MNAPAITSGRAKSKLALVALALITTGGFVAHRVARCVSLDEAPVQSPDGKWVVTSTSRGCPAGPLSATNYDVFVTLNARPSRGSPVPGSVRIFEASDSAEPPTLTWTSTNELRLELKEMGAVTTSKHEIDNIRVRYVVPKWIWNHLNSIESDHLEQDRHSEELFRAGKLSSDDLRMSLENSAAVAKEQMKFRQWIQENATVEE